MKADVASRRVETKMEERKSGVRVVRWPTLTFWKLPKVHGLPNMVFGLDLQTRQLPSPWDMRSALTFRSPNMVVLGGVSSTFMLQPIKKSPNPWRHHGKFHNPLAWFYVAGEYYSSVLEYFLGPNINIYMSNSTWGVPKLMELTISSYCLAYKKVIRPIFLHRCIGPSPRNRMRVKKCAHHM